MAYTKHGTLTADEVTTVTLDGAGGTVATVVVRVHGASGPVWHTIGTGTVADPVAEADDTYRLDSSFPAASHRGNYSDAVVVKLLTAATGVGFSVEVY